VNVDGDQQRLPPPALEAPRVARLVFLEHQSAPSLRLRALVDDRAVAE
jgi:hypothetical protein